MWSKAHIVSATHKVAYCAHDFCVQASVLIQCACELVSLHVVIKPKSSNMLGSSLQLAMNLEQCQLATPLLCTLPGWPGTASLHIGS